MCHHVSDLLIVPQLILEQCATGHTANGCISDIYRKIADLELYAAGCVRE